MYDERTDAACLSAVRGILDKKYGYPNVGLYLDLANVWATAKDNGTSPDTKGIVDLASQLGELKILKAFITVKCGTVCNPGIIRLQKEGYEIIPRFLPEHSSGNKKDIDTYLVAEFMKDLYTSNVDVFVIVSDDSDFTPVLIEAKRAGKISISFVSSSSTSSSLVSASSYAIEIGHLRFDNISREKIDVKKDLRAFRDHTIKTEYEGVI